MELRRGEKITIAVFGAISAMSLGAMVFPDSKEDVQSYIVEHNPIAPDQTGEASLAQPTEDVQSSCTDIRSVPLNNQIGATVLLIGEANQLDQIRDTMQRDLITSFALSDSSNSISDQVPYRGGITDFAVATNDLIGSTEAVIGPVTFAIDQEGGTVQRLEPLTSVESLPSAQEQANLPEDVLSEIIKNQGRNLSAVGVNLVFGPVLDVGQQGFIGSRSYGNDPSTVASKAEIFISALESEGIYSTGKHYPDHGYVETDTHNSAGMSRDITTLSTEGALPVYQRLFEDGSLKYVMTNHLTTPGLTEPGQPSSLSPNTYELLDSQGFNGVAMTDALAMDAIEEYLSADNEIDAQGKAAVMALNAGADMVLVNLDAADTVIQYIKAAIESGELSKDKIAEAAATVWINKDTPVDMCGYE